MKHLLITGGAGFIGTNFVYYWLDKYPADHVVVLDALTYAGNRANLKQAEKNPRFSFVHGNILDQPLVESLLLHHNIDTIVHFAAESHVDRSILGPDAFIDTNVVGTHSLLKAARNVWLDGNQKRHRFHHISTDEVYGSLKPGDPPFTEATAYVPNSPYAASKAASDHLVRAYHKTYGLQTTISNCSNNYGPFQFPEKLIPLIVINILNGKPLPVYGDGRQIRDWLFVDDHNLGVDLIIQKGEPGQTFNIGGENEWENIKIVKLLCDMIHDRFENDADLKARFPSSPSAVGRHPENLISHVPDRAGHDRRYAIDCGYISSQLEFSANESFGSGLQKTISWILSHETWWRNLMDQRYLKWIKKNYS